MMSPTAIVTGLESAPVTVTTRDPADALADADAWLGALSPTGELTRINADDV